MGKMNILYKHLLLLVLILLKMNSYSQELFTKELLWASQDSIETLIFNDTNQIFDWGKNQLPFSTVFSKNVLANNTKVFVLMVSGCSGLPCWNIYVFREKEGTWHLTAKTNTRLKEQIKIDADRSKNKILFKTETGQIGELPFETLNLSSNKTD